jgi:pimeloyl-ACP methyl ester carboxylesterase
MSGGTAAQTPDRIAELPEIEGVTHRYVETGRVRIHYAEAGDGPPVLLLHGWPQHWFMWREVIERLAPQFRLIAPDLRGFGWSEAPGEGYDGETFAADQVDLLDALEIDTASVIGHDWGGWTAFLLGLAHPDRIERMVVCNAPHPWPKVEAGLLLESWRSWYAVANASPLLGRWLAESRWMPRQALSHGNVGDPFAEGIEIYLDQFREPARAEASMKLYRYYLRTFARGVRGGGYRDRRLSVPTLLLFGEGDRYVSPKLLRGFEAHADEMKLELVPDSGHFLVDEKPDLVSRRALAFLS